MPYFESGDDRELKVDLMLKRSQGKKKILTAVNYKERVFVLTRKQLQYCEGTTEVNRLVLSLVSSLAFASTSTTCMSLTLADMRKVLA